MEENRADLPENSEDYTFFKDVAENVLSIVKVKQLKDRSAEIIFSDTQNFTDFATEFTFLVIDVGMDDEDTVNEIGKRLYNIYDKILYQKHNQK